MNKTYKAINRSVLNHELISTPHDSERIFTHPVITIARDPGSGGNPIGKLVAQKLKYSFYDDELIEAIAKSTSKRTKVIKNVDEKTRTVIEDIVHNLFNPDYISESTYLKHLTNVVLSLAHTGKAVLLGRGANFIIPNADSFNVLITAPKKVRIKRAVYYEGHSITKARAIIDKYSHQRKGFVSQYFNKGYHNPIYYDLVINTEYFDIQAASDIIVTAFRKKYSLT